jgi:hypothetical protein
MRLTFRRVCAKYIAAAMRRLDAKGRVAERELSLLERILAGDPDPSTACILALDFILVGIDTVSSCSRGELSSSGLGSQDVRSEQNFHSLCRFPWPCAPSCTNWPHDRRSRRRFTEN